MQAGALIARQIEQLAASYGVNRAEGDVLFTLRRSGPPYRLLPSQLSEALLVSSGALTSQLDRLERKALIERTPIPVTVAAPTANVTPSTASAAN